MGGDMGDEWNSERLANVASIVMGQSPPGSTYNQSGEGVPFFQGVKDFGSRHPAPRVYCTAPTRFAEAGDILLSVRAPIGEINRAPVRCCIGRGLAAIRAKYEYDTNFLEYALRSIRNEWRTLESQGAVFGNAKKGDLETLEIPWPARNERWAIAHILGTLDDKIELSRQMNSTLEAMAQALFKSWFIDFDPVVVNALRAGNPVPEKFAQRAAHYRDNPNALRLPEDTLRQFPDRFQDSELGPIPEGWWVGILADLAELNADSWNQKTLPDEILYVDLSNTKFGIIESVKTFNKQDAPSRARRILKPGDTIMGVVRPANKSYAMVGETPNILTGSTGFAVLSPKSAVFREYVYLQATNEENITRLARLADGAAYPAVRPNVVADTKCVISDEQVLKLFHEATVDLYDKFHENNSESETLSTLRDTLLPKLISGELRVPDAEKLMEDVA